MKVLFLSLFLSSTAFGNCLTNDKEFAAAFNARVKGAAVYQTENGILHSSMDDKEFQQAAQEKTPHADCARVAHGLAEPANLRALVNEDLRRLICGTENISFIFNVNPKLGLTTFVRSQVPGHSELMIGASYDLAGKGLKGCQDVFLTSLREAVHRALEAAPELAPLTPEEEIRQALLRLTGGIEPFDMRSDCP